MTTAMPGVNEEFINRRCAHVAKKNVFYKFSKLVTWVLEVPPPPYFESVHTYKKIAAWTAIESQATSHNALLPAPLASMAILFCLLLSEDGEFLLDTKCRFNE